MSLIPQVIKAVNIPVIAAGGIANGSQVAAALALGASAVQIGTRFAATKESSAHDNFKQAIISASSGDTKLMMKNLVPVRLLDNKFSREVKALEDKSASNEELSNLLGRGRAKKGMLDGDMDEGELEIGQVSALVDDIPSCQELMNRILSEYNETVSNLSTFN